jgi:hypothetical protein
MEDTKGTFVSKENVSAIVSYPAKHLIKADYPQNLFFQQISKILKTITRHSGTKIIQFKRCACAS